MISVSDFFLACGELLLLYIVALVLGKIVSKIPRGIRFFLHYIYPEKDTSHWPPLPDFLGMLFAGILLGNVPGALISAIPNIWSSSIRKAALSIILARAGLSLDIIALKKLGGATLRLASMPCIAESVVAAAVTKLLRSETSWGFCFSLGFLLAAVSPAVVVPSLLALKDEGYGGHIPTMVLAAASLDDVLAICGMGIAIDVAFAAIEGGGGQTAIIWTAMIAPITVFGGIAVGSALGYGQYLLTRVALKHSSNRVCALLASDTCRSLLLLLLSLAAVFLTTAIGFDAGGYLAVMVSGLVVARGWDKLEEGKEHSSVPHDDEDAEEPKNETKKSEETPVPSVFGGTAAVSAVFKTLWSWMMPALFMLIGAQVHLEDISASQVGTAFAVLAISLSVRLVVTFSVSGLGTSLTRKERMFLALAWFPKATVQAALGSVALDRANALSIDDDDVEEAAVSTGKFLLTAAVLAIMVTAPLGAIGIFVAGPLWLTRDPKYGGGARDEEQERHSDGSLSVESSGPYEPSPRGAGSEEGAELCSGDMVIEMAEAVDPGSSQRSL